MNINTSLGAWRNATAIQATALSIGAHEPMWGQLSRQHIQICPQQSGRLDEAACEAVQQIDAQAQFRLHANVRVAGADWSPVIDASTFHLAPTGYYDRIAQLSGALKAPAYTWHAGRRRHATLEEVLWRTRALEDAMGIPVGIEGMYPSKSGYLLDSWEEYAQLLEGHTHYAIDLSHLNILAKATGRQEMTLVRELLANPLCLEIHVSGNDGSGDQHAQLQHMPWWYPALSSAHEGAVIFSEGGQTRPMYC